MSTTQTPTIPLKNTKLRSHISLIHPLKNYKRKTKESISQKPRTNQTKTENSH